MRQTVWTPCRVALAACVAVGSLIALGESPAAGKAAETSTWYWQNPRPQGESMAGVACRTVAACVAVGRDGSIVTTVDGAQHWTHSASGTTANLSNVTCPDRTICYALGSSPEDGRTVFLTSVDEGKTWRHPSSHLPTRPDQFVNELVCPSATACLVGGPPGPLLRTTDGGRAWHTVSVSGLQFVVFALCATRSVCYATGPVKKGGSSNPGPGLLRSADGGKTWKVRGRAPRGGFGAMACPLADTCFATAANCGAECRSEGNVFLTRDGARTWKEVVHNAIGDSLGSIACPSVTTCYAHTERSVVRTINGGKTWSIRHLPDPTGFTPGPDMACPNPTICYVASGFTVLKTSDGFDHSQETLAQSVFHDLSLNVISCPRISSCYAAGSHLTCPGGGGCHDVPAPFAVTSDGGRTWRETPKPPDVFGRLSCPDPRVCFATSPFLCCSPERDAAIDRSGDGARTWQRQTLRHIVAPFIPVQYANTLPPEISCVTVTTCYVTAGLLKVKANGFAPILSLLVTQNGGRTWSVRIGIDAAVRAGAPRASTELTLDSISCPSIITCIVMANASGNHGRSSNSLFFSTADGGKTWRRHSLPSGGRRGRLVCPTITTCYVVLYPLPGLITPARVTAFVLVTHDGGVRWHRTVFSPDRLLVDIACATALACRVVGEDGIFGTEDGGMTWRRQHLANGKRFPRLAGIACPAVARCYGIGDVTIVANHL